MIFQYKNPPCFHIMNKITNIPVDNLQDFYIHSLLRFLYEYQPSHMIFQQNNLPQFYTMNQIPSLPVQNPQAFRVCSLLSFLQKNQASHLIFQQKNLPQFQIMNQVNYLSANKSPYFNLKSLLILLKKNQPSHWRNLYQIRLLHQVTIPVDIPPFFLSQTQLQYSRHPSTRLKCPFQSYLQDLLMHLQPHFSKQSH